MEAEPEAPEVEAEPPPRRPLYLLRLMKTCQSGKQPATATSIFSVGPNGLESCSAKESRRAIELYAGSARTSEAMSTMGWDTDVPLDPIYGRTIQSEWSELEPNL